ncbi:MAG: SLBB domain-containing protein, partial [Deltaproteobacteria bacterium]|nr:SLBB domain-containing protein [Deltaproteobacteria bacterium]
ALRRGGKALAELDLYSFILRGVLEGDRPLENGDVIVLPRARHKVWAFGKVRRPSIYELRDGEGLRALLDFAGGLSSDAFGGLIQVERSEKNRARVVLDVALADLGQDFALQDGDVVRAFTLTPEIENRVSLYGHVYQPGTYALKPGMRITDVLRSADSLKPDVELSYAIVLRQTGADRAKTVLPFRLGAALDRSEPGENLALQAGDELYVFSRYQFRPPLQAKASGAVRQPDPYRFEQGATAVDLLRLAGGPTPEALLSRVEVLRYLPDRSRQTLYLDLAKALAGDARENPILADEDELVVHSVWDRTFRESASIAGEVKRPGEVPLTQGMTVGDLVFKAGSLTRDAYLPLGHLYRTDRVTKEVTIHTFDLGKALGGDSAENLLLADGDRVTIHSAYEFAPQQQVVLSGMVNKPGDYPYATNLRVRDLVLAGGGLKEEAFLGEAEVVRAETVPGQSTETKTLRFDLGKALAGDLDANLALKPYDKVFVKKVPEWRETEKVEVAGEVVFPGTYYVAKGETLASVLRRAGGYTSEAYLAGALFTRESARLQQQQRLDELTNRLQQAVLRASSAEAQASLSPEDLAAQKQYLAGQEALVKKLASVKATGRVVVKLLPLGELEASDWNVVLEDGDTLRVPRAPQTVTVVGQVYNPTALLWEPDRRTVGHYLAKTGGPTADAEKGEMYVVRADGTVVSEGSLKAGSWWSKGIENVDLAPGDSILVPEKVVRVSYMREFRDLTQILYQIAVTAGVAVALFREGGQTVRRAPTARRPVPPEIGRSGEPGRATES